jgi:hypothetical protein
MAVEYNMKEDTNRMRYGMDEEFQHILDTRRYKTSHELMNSYYIGESAICEVDTCSIKSTFRDKVESSGRRRRSATTHAEHYIYNQ